MGCAIRTVESVAELAEAFDVIGAQVSPRLTHRDRRFAELARRFPEDRALILIAEGDGRIVGGALAFRRESPPASGVTLRLMGVRPDRRGAGLGTRLLTRIEEAAVDIGAAAISLGPSGPERAFYERLGHRGRSRMHKELAMKTRRDNGREPWR
jgi:GNAT superfamily N-acetyltransferase